MPDVHPGVRSPPFEGEAVVRVLSGTLHVVIWMWVVMGRAWVVNLLRLRLRTGCVFGHIWRAECGEGLERRHVLLGGQEWPAGAYMVSTGRACVYSCVWVVSIR